MPRGVRGHAKVWVSRRTAALIVRVVSLLCSGSFGTMPAGWERAGWCTERSSGSGCERGVRRVERDGGACPGRLWYWRWIVCGAALCRRRHEGVDAVWRFAGRWPSAPPCSPSISRCENPGSGAEVVCRAIAVLAFLELLAAAGADWIGPFLFGAGLADLEFELASIHQPHSE